MSRFTEKAESNRAIMRKFNKEGLDTRNKKRMKMRVLSLFSGCGGLDLGFELAGHKVIFANDAYKPAAETFQHNFPEVEFITGKVEKIEKFPEHDILIGGYPCQSFSIAGNLLIADDRNKLYLEFLRCLKQARPMFFLAENVANLAQGKRYSEIFDAMVKSYKEIGYNVKWDIFDAKDFGIPQDRRRVIIVGVREDIGFEYDFPKPTHGLLKGDAQDLQQYSTLRDAIWDLQDNPGPVYEGRYPPRFLSRNRTRLWDEVSYTIVATADQNPMHPSTGRMRKVGQDKFEFTKENVRRLSARECARIMSFPDSFEFKGPGLNHIYKQIGNAVVPLLAFKLARQFPIAKKNEGWIFTKKNLSYRDIIKFNIKNLR